MSADQGQEVAVRLRDAEQLGDDRDRDELEEVADEVEFAAGLGGVDDPVDDRLDPRPERLDGPRGERLQHEPSQAGVIGRLHVDHLDAEEIPEGGLVGRRRAATPGLVAGDVEI